MGGAGAMGDTGATMGDDPTAGAGATTGGAGGGAVCS